MVRQMLWLFISVMISHAGWANDPFDKNRRQGMTQATSEKRQIQPATLRRQPFSRKRHLSRFKSSAYYNITPIGKSSCLLTIKSALPIPVI